MPKTDPTYPWLIDTYPTVSFGLMFIASFELVGMLIISSASLALLARTRPAMPSITNASSARP